MTEAGQEQLELVSGELMSLPSKVSPSMVLLLTVATIFGLLILPEILYMVTSSVPFRGYGIGFGITVALYVLILAVFTKRWSGQLKFVELSSDGVRGVDLKDRDWQVPWDIVVGVTIGGSKGSTVKLIAIETITKKFVITYSFTYFERLLRIVRKLCKEQDIPIFSG